MAFAHSFPIDGTKPQDDDTISNKYPDPFRPDGGGMSRARRSPRIVVLNGSFGTCVRSTTSIVFTGSEVAMSCSIFGRSPRQDRWSAKPRLGLVLNIATRFRDFGPAWLAHPCCGFLVVASIGGYGPAGATMAERYRYLRGSGLCNRYLVTWPWGASLHRKSETTTRPFRSIFESIPQALFGLPRTADGT